MKPASAFRLLPALAALILPSFAQVSTNCPPLTAERVIANLVQKNQERAEALPPYRSVRSYKIDYGGFGGARDAEMVVKMQFTPPSTKTFIVRSQTGSKLLNDRVFKKLLEEEQVAFQPENQRRTALNESNYSFALESCEITSRGSAYVLKVDPKEKSKYLYKGKVWIDALDFAVEKIAAEPAKNPSFWVRQAKIEQSYTKVDQFWLPAKNRSVTSVRLGGHAELTIVYGEYEWTGSELPLRTSNEKPSE
jgi:hypothetical protein